MSPADAPTNLNDVWARCLVEELCRQGADAFVVAPGSRSALLALSARKLARSCTVHWDERAAGFYALGRARATGRPAVVITTSGTAGANLLPAVAEAANDGVPLIVITADRPPELRDTGANQTLDQVHLFGSRVRWFHELGPSDPRVPVQAVLTAADHAVARALGDPGPVHLNMPFREPLSPTMRDDEAGQAWASLGDWLIRNAPQTRVSGTARELEADAVAALATRLTPDRRGLVVLGGGADPEAAAEAVAIARACQWPVLADIASGWRLRDDPQVMAYADHVLMSRFWSEHLRPDAVLQVGPRITSKRITAFLAEARPDDWVLLTGRDQRLDETHRVTWAVRGGAVGLAAVRAKLTPAPAGAWIGSWKDADHLVDEAMDKFLEVLPDLNEASLARALSRELPPGHVLFAGNSMPIRDLDRMAAPGWGGVVVANRGVSGIDGLVATASGYAAEAGCPITLLLGDLSLLHDVTSLRLLAHTGQPCVVNVINNDGGGIFHFLPVAGSGEGFEDMLGTPHGLRFKEPARWLGFTHVEVTTLEGWVKAYREAVARGGCTLIELRTDRRENLNVHHALDQRILNALDDMAPYQDGANPV